MASTSPGSGASLPKSPQIPHMPGSQGYAVASCHVERPLDDRVWQRYRQLVRRRPGGFAIASLMRPPAPVEDAALFVARAREATELGPFGHHIHWTSPTHARPTAPDPAGAVRRAAIAATLRLLALRRRPVSLGELGAEREVSWSDVCGV